jgi:hypothetical protein
MFVVSLWHCRCSSGPHFLVSDLSKIILYTDVPVSVVKIMHPAHRSSWHCRCSSGPHFLVSDLPKIILYTDVHVSVVKIMHPAHRSLWHCRCSSGPHCLVSDLPKIILYTDVPVSVVKIMHTNVQTKHSIHVAQTMHPTHTVVHIAHPQNCYKNRAPFTLSYTLSILHCCTNYALNTSSYNLRMCLTAVQTIQH